MTYATEFELMNKHKCINVKDAFIEKIESGKNML